MMNITIAFVQMRRHYVFPRKEPEAICHVKNKTAGGAGGVFLSVVVTRMRGQRQSPKSRLEGDEHLAALRSYWQK